MSLEENKAEYTRFFDEVLNGRNLAVLDELNTPNMVDHARSDPRPDLSDLEAAKESVAMLHRGFPDIKWSLDDMIAEGDRVVARWTAHGTHEGEFMGIPPTGKQVTFSGIEIVRIEDGKGVEHWEQFGVMSLMQQLGALPPPGGPPD